MPGTLLFMGHREDLLEGAKRCLLEKGYARTTARDIVAASGTNLASIGYHYGSKEALLNLAFLKVTEEWGELLTKQPDDAGRDDGSPRAPLDQFRDVWEQVIGSYERTRAVWQLQMEVVSRVDSDPELQKALAARSAKAGTGSPRTCWASTRRPTRSGRGSPGCSVRRCWQV